jgi:glycosyltransferase involved in cell wall biosynthesis
MWGGSIATTTAIMNSFKDDPEIDFKILTSEDIKSVEQIKEFIKDADIVHLDENVNLCSLFEKEGLRCDIIGPTMRSPVKRYYVDVEKTKLWEAPYSYTWYYSHPIIRLNYQEERENILKDEFKGVNFRKRVDLILHAIDTENLKPSPNHKNKYILWAGDKYRDAKNYNMFDMLTKDINMRGGLPKGYEFKVMSGYRVKDYWDELDNTAILVNTSKYESFCNAMYEAQAKGVPTIYKKGMHGEIAHADSRIQVDYNVDSYREAIFDLLNSPDKLKLAGEFSRDYALKNCSYKAMNESIKKVYRRILNDRGHTSRSTD